MKIRNILLATVLSAFAFASCSDDDSKDLGGSSAVVIKATIDKQTKTRAVGTSWSASDVIGVYMKKAGQDLPANVVNAADNMKYTTPGSGAFSAATPAHVINFPADGSNVDFIAYYPYQTTIAGHTYKVNVATQTNQEAIDLLYSNNAVNLNKDTQTGVSMTFAHELTKIEINVVAGGGITSLTGLEVTLAGTKTQADFALANGDLTTTSATASDIKMKSTPSGTMVVAEAIILPAVATADRVLVFTLGAQTFKWTVPATTEFVKSKRYTYNAVLETDGSVTVVSPNATITDWNDAPAETIKPELVGSEGDGTLAKPYTIEQALTKTGENTKWVTGYIIGSTAKTKAFPAKNTNILLAASPTETDESKCIPVDIDGSLVQANLDLVANGTLLGQKVKVQGNIVNNIFGGVVALTAVIAQEGGATPGPGPGGDPVELFHETFGDGDVSTRPKIGVYTGWSATKVTYSDPYGTWADIRATGSLPNHVWFPGTTADLDKTSALLIEGIESGYTKMSLSYDIATNTAGTNANIIQVICNETPVTIPSMSLAAMNKFETITVSIPDGTTKIEIKSGTNNVVGFRIDNIKLVGVK